MNRRTFVRSVALPLAACAAVGVGWARSYRVMDEWSCVTAANESRAVLVYQGAIHVTRGTTPTAATRPWSYDTHDVPAGATWANVYPFGGPEWNRAGMIKVSPVRYGFAGPSPNPFNPPPKLLERYSPTPWLPLSAFHAWAVPIWWLLVLSASPIIRLSWRAWRAARRVRAGNCPRCRYDLRATPDRCPECGWPDSA